MSIVGILASSALSLLTPRAQNPTKTLKQNFQQLGQDLKSGNLSAAQFSPPCSKTSQHPHLPSRRHQLLRALAPRSRKTLRSFPSTCNTEI
jgi:hypothetical protein